MQWKLHELAIQAGMSCSRINRINLINTQTHSDHITNIRWNAESQHDKFDENDCKINRPYLWFCLVDCVLCMYIISKNSIFIIIFFDRFSHFHFRRTIYIQFRCYFATTHNLSADKLEKNTPITDKLQTRKVYRCRKIMSIRIVLRACALFHNQKKHPQWGQTFNKFVGHFSIWTKQFQCNRIFFTALSRTIKCETFAYVQTKDFHTQISKAFYRHHFHFTIK